MGRIEGVNPVLKYKDSTDMYLINSHNQKRFGLLFDGIEDTVVCPRLLDSNNWTLQINIENQNITGRRSFFRQYEFGALPPLDPGRLFFASDSGVYAIFQGTYRYFGSSALGNYIYTFVCNNGSLSFYVNGTLIDTRTGFVTPENDDFVIAAKWTNETLNFEGIYKYLWAFDFPFSAQQVADNLNLKLHGNETGLIRLYDFFPGAVSDRLYDRASGAKHGIINGAEYVELTQ